MKALPKKNQLVRLTIMKEVEVFQATKKPGTSFLLKPGQQLLECQFRMETASGYTCVYSDWLGDEVFFPNDSIKVEVLP